MIFQFLVPLSLILPLYHHLPRLPTLLIFIYVWMWIPVSSIVYNIYVRLKSALQHKLHLAPLQVLQTHSLVNVRLLLLIHMRKEDKFVKYVKEETIKANTNCYITVLVERFSGDKLSSPLSLFVRLVYAQLSSMFYCCCISVHLFDYHVCDCVA